MKRKIEFKAWIPALNMFLTGFTIHQRSEMIGIHADDLEEQLAAKGYEIDDNGDVRVINDTEDEDLPALPSTSFLCGEDYYWYDKEFELCQYADLLDTENAPIFEGHILTIPEFYETPEMTHTNFINWGGGLQVFGAFATDGTKIIGCGPRVTNAQGYYTLFENWSGATSSALSAGPTQTNLVGKYQFGSQIYLQMSYASSTTTLVCSASFDGLRFIPLFTTTSPGFVPTGFGFSYNPDTATVNDWFSILGVN